MDTESYKQWKSTSGGGESQRLQENNLWRIEENWKEKALHEDFNRPTEEIGTDDSWRWLKNEFL